MQATRWRTVKIFQVLTFVREIKLPDAEQRLVHFQKFFEEKLCINLCLDPSWKLVEETPVIRCRNGEIAVVLPPILEIEFELVLKRSRYSFVSVVMVESVDEHVERFRLIIAPIEVLQLSYHLSEVIHQYRSAENTKEHCNGA